MENYIFNLEDFKPVKHILEQNASCPVKIEDVWGGSTLDFNGDGVKLYIKTLGTYELILSSVEVRNRNAGACTKIMQWLIEYGKGHQFASFVVENAISDPLVHLCKKYGMELKRSSAIDQEKGYGCWYLKLA